MTHFAKVENGLVTDVIVAEQNFIDTLPEPSLWIQTSYNTRGNVHYNPDTGLPDEKPALRGNYAFIGGSYDAVNDVFINPQPFLSWSISAETNWLWEAPVPYPTDGKMYDWDETTLSWVPIPTLTKVVQLP